MIRSPISILLLSLLPCIAACGDPSPGLDEPTTGPFDGFGDSAASSTGSGDEEDTAARPDCVDAVDCDDGVFCNGVEACVDGTCVAGTSPDCTDEVGCTIDGCDSTLDQCVHAPDHGRCGCAETCDATMGCGDYCVPADCQGHVYQCGDCIDNDGDCLVDAAEPECWGACDDNEQGWAPDIPGGEGPEACLQRDCYFDQDSGPGNDDCRWSHSCDPLEPTGCTADPEYNVPGTPLSCDELQVSQSQVCEDFCGPLVPNGCDCFGCCEVQLEDTTVTVYLGTHDAEGHSTCNSSTAEDPELCHPCTQVPACLNACEDCELCLGQGALPPECDEQTCPDDLQPCGLPGQDPCPEAYACVTGCCIPPIP